MITSINGLSNTPIQDNTIQKENAKMSKEQEKALIDKLMHKPLVEVLPKFIDIDESKDNWITDAINKIDTMLSKKYDFTIEQRRALIAKYPENMKSLRLVSYKDTWTGYLPTQWMANRRYLERWLVLAQKKKKQS